MKSNTINHFPTFLLLAAVIAVSLPAQTSSSTPFFHWSTLAGRASVGLEDGVVADARFNRPHGLAQDSSGNLYVADTGNHTIRKITAAGMVSTLAGLAEQSGSADGVGATARFNQPQGIAVDLSGNVYVADTGNHTIRKITPAGIVTTLAGQAGVKGTADGAATAALFDSPDRLTVDTAGNVFLANNGIRQISGGQVKTLTVPAQAVNPDGVSINLRSDRCPAVDAIGNLYFASSSPSELVKVDSTGKATVLRDSFFGTDTSGSTYAYHYSGDTIFNDSSGNLFLTVQVSSANIIRGVEGVRMQPDGTLDKQHVASFASPIGQPVAPLGLAVDQTGKWYFTRSGDHAIMNPGSNAPFTSGAPLSPGTAYAGTPLTSPGIDGTGQAARFADLAEVTADSSGNVWTTETATQYPFDTVRELFTATTRLRKISPSRAVSTPTQPWFPVASSGIDIEQYPTGLTSDSAGNVYLSKRKNFDYVFELLKITPDTTISPLGTSLSGYGYVYDPAVDASGNLSLLNSFSNLSSTPLSYIQVIQLQKDGTWKPLAGGPSNQIKDGTGSDARFNYAHDYTSDKSGNLFLIDTVPGIPDPLIGDAYIRKVSPSGVVTTVSNKLTSSPSGLAVDSKGTFYLTHTASNLITRIDASGVEVVIGGKNGISGSHDGTADEARFSAPGKITVDAQDNLYVVDGYGTTIRTTRLIAEAGPVITTQPQNQTAAAGGNVEFSIAASGDPAPTYQWNFNGSPMAGATTTTLKLTSVKSTDAGDYTVVVTNPGSSVTSSKATLSVSITTNSSPSSAPTSGGSGSGGGGGAINGWFVLYLFAAGVARKLRTGNGRS